MNAVLLHGAPDLLASIVPKDGQSMGLKMNKILTYIIQVFEGAR
jgi:hypothetical protein